MKKIILILIGLFVALLIYNITNIDFSDSLKSVPNQQVYLRLLTNVLMLIALAYNYRRYSRRLNNKS
jgi:uncharacterized membrane protein YbhN (UPF0104 family)